MTKKYVSISIPWNTLGKFFLNASLMSLFLITVKSYVHNLISLIVISITGTIIYLLISYLNKGFSIEDRESINNIIGKNIFFF